MFYTCNRCNNEFEWNPPIHPHTSQYGSRLSLVGCPICAKMASTPPICPNCLSSDLTIKLK